MSGIVRGFVYPEAIALYARGEKTNIRTFVHQNEPDMLPVAVVPLDDATLTAMADWFLAEFESNTKLEAMRAALGLDHSTPLHTSEDITHDR